MIVGEIHQTWNLSGPHDFYDVLGPSLANIREDLEEKTPGNPFHPISIFFGEGNV